MHMVWQELVNSGRLSPSDFVRVTSTAAAQLFNVYPRKGVVAPGSDADVVIFDPHRDHVISAASHHSAMDTNIYEGYAVRGKVGLGKEARWRSGRRDAAVPGAQAAVCAATAAPIGLRVGGGGSIRVLFNNSSVHASRRYG
jgi:hypothetical protein